MGGTGTLVCVRRLLCLLPPLAMILVTACSSAPADPAGEVRLTGANRAATTFSDWPMSNRNRFAEQQRSALLVENGRVVVAFGGLAGDCDNYVGYVTSTSTSGTGRTHHYAVPTAREAGMWATGGPVLGANGHVYAASGNGAELGGKWDKSDSLTELGPKTLHRRAD